ncbi:uncharacterized protein LOC135366379 [Ornithodoros turicata]|uniref:uncharacterized protein LOC135366379 n=1 Tax=Ornithodoros turicata TaxID=34597 RepID=UPI003139E62F
MTSTETSQPLDRREDSVSEEGGISQPELERLRLEIELENARSRRIELEISRGNSERSSQSSSPSPDAREDALGRYAKRLKSVLLPLPSDLEVPVWFDGIEGVFRSYSVPENIQSHLILPLVTRRVKHLYSKLSTEELDSYDAVKDAVLKELRLAPGEYRKQFLGATKGRDEGWSHFASRVKSYLSYYVRSREVDSFDELIELIAADQLKTTISPAAYEYVKVQEGSSWAGPASIAEMVDAFEEAKGIGAGIKARGSQSGSAGQTQSQGGATSNVSAREAHEKPHKRELEGKKPNQSGLRCFRCGGPHFARSCPRKQVEHRRGEVAATVARVSVAVAPAEAPVGGAASDERLECKANCALTVGVDQVSVLQMVDLCSDGTTVRAIVDTGAQVTVMRASLFPRECAEATGSVTLVSAFGEKVRASLGTLRLALCEEGAGNGIAKSVYVLCAFTEELATGTDCLLSGEAYELLTSGARVIPEGVMSVDIEEGGSTDERSCFEVEVESTSSDEAPSVVADAVGEQSRTSECAEFRASQREDRSLSEEWGRAKNGTHGFEVIDGALYHREKIPGRMVRQLVLPQSRRNEVLLLAHDSPWGGHLGLRKTLARVKANFYWPDLDRDVREYCRTCNSCQLISDRRVTDRVPIAPLTRPAYPFQAVNVDIIGPIEPKSARGHRYALCMTDLHTRWPEVVCMTTFTARKTCDALLKIFARTGGPGVVCSDNGSNFTSSLTKEFLLRIGSAPRFSTVEHPESNGSVERWNRVFKKMLFHVVQSDPRNWDQHVPFLLWAYREVPHDTTGVSPFELLYGRKPVGPMGILKNTWSGEVDIPNTLREAPAKYMERLRQQLQLAADVAGLTASKNQETYAAQYNRRAKPKSFNPGDQVLIFEVDRQGKLFPKWRGPYTVVAGHRQNSYVVLGTDGKRKTVHANHLRQYHARLGHVGVVFQIDEDFGVVEHAPALADDVSDALPDAAVQHLTRGQAREIRGIIESFRTLFVTTPGIAKVGEHQIVLKEGHAPTKRHAYRVPEMLRGEVEKQVSGLLEQGLIYPTNSPFAHPVVCVAKKGRRNSIMRRLPSVKRRNR